MICTNCSKEIDDDSKFCIYCGAKQIDQINYEEGNLEPFYKDGKWGYKDISSRDVIIPLKYDIANPFIENRAIISVNNKYAIIDQNGKELTQFKYDFIVDFQNGIAKIKRDDKWAIMDIDCHELTSFKYSEIKLYVVDDLSLAEIGGKYVLINKFGKEITLKPYDEIYEFQGTVTRVKNENKYGLINKSGKEILSCSYDYIGLFNINDLAKIKLNNKYGLVDISGKIILSCEYDNIGNLTDELVPIKKDGKYGILNHLGEAIISSIYKKIRLLSKDNIAAKTEEGWKCFNKEGVEVTETDPVFFKFKRRRKRLLTALIIIIPLLTIVSLGIYDYYTNEIGIIYETKTIIYGADKVDWEIALKKADKYNPNPYKQYLKLHPQGEHVSEAESKIEDYVWQEANYNNNLNSFKGYLQKYPNGKYSSLAKEDTLWLYAVEYNTSYSYNKYLQKYPNGSHSSLAKENILWLQAQSSNSLSLYEEYLNKFPNGSYVNTAWNNIENIMWKRALRANNLSLYEKYLNKFPYGSYANIAKNNIENILWKRALRTNNRENYEYYLTHYPNGRFAEEAKKNIEKLDWFTAIYANSVKSYTNYINKYPNGTYLSIAKQKLKLCKVKPIILSSSGLTVYHRILDNNYINNYDKFEIWNNEGKKIIGHISYIHNCRHIRWRKMKKLPNSIKKTNYCDDVLKCTLYKYTVKKEFHGSKILEPASLKGVNWPVNFQMIIYGSSIEITITQNSIP